MTTKESLAEIIQQLHFLRQQLEGMEARLRTIEFMVIHRPAPIPLPRDEYRPYQQPFVPMPTMPMLPPVIPKWHETWCKGGTAEQMPPPNAEAYCQELPVEKQIFPRAYINS